MQGIDLSAWTAIDFSTLDVAALGIEFIFHRATDGAGITAFGLANSVDTQFAAFVAAPLPLQMRGAYLVLEDQPLDPQFSLFNSVVPWTYLCALDLEPGEFASFGVDRAVQAVQAFEAQVCATRHLPPVVYADIDVWAQLYEPLVAAVPDVVPWVAAPSGNAPSYARLVQTGQRAIQGVTVDTDTLDRAIVPVAYSTFPIVAGAAADGGYDLVAEDGGVFNFGVGFYGSTYSLGLTGLSGDRPLAARIVGAGAASAGYWLVGADGGVFNFGDAAFYGNTYTLGLTGLGGARPLAARIVGMAPTSSRDGYWLVGADGGVFNFGAAQFAGNTYTLGLTGLSGNRPLAAPVVGIAASPTGGGYWLAAADGGVFNFGVGFYGNTYTLGLTGLAGDRPLAGRIVGIAATPSGEGYWLVGADGGVFNFGDAPFLGSAYTLGFTGLGGTVPLPKPVVGVMVAPGGYALVGEDGSVYPFGGFPYRGHVVTS